MTQLTLTEQQKNGQLPEKPNTEALQKLEEFARRLYDSPEKGSIKENDKVSVKMHGKSVPSRYVPISPIQTTLDEVFMGLWNFELKSYQVVANEIVGVGLLEVFHPVAKVWIRRSGTGAVMIQQQSGAAITDIGAKYKNTLVKDFPHLEAECLKSAAKKLGPLFGRDLNREHDDNYQPIYTQEAELGAELPEIKKKLNNCATVEEVKALMEMYTDHPAKGMLRPLFTAKVQELKVTKKP